MSDDLLWLSCEALIAEVEKRPGIYDRLHPDYKKDEKERLWLDVCEAIVPNWNELSLPEKNSKVIVIQRKWKNLRDSFRKEINIQYQIKPSRYPKKKREYLYFKSMQFLEPFLRESETTSKRSIQHEDQQDINLKCKSEDSENTNSSKRKRKNKFKFWKDNQSSESDTTKKPRQSSPNIELWEESEIGDLNDIDNYTFHEDIDEDRYFLLSLLPSLRTLSNKQKLSVRVDFLQILQKIGFSNNVDSLITS